MVNHGLALGADFDLDFHAIMHWGEDPILEKHYVPTRSQRARSVLTFFAQDADTHNLVYTNADVSKASQNREILAFADHWREHPGAWPGQLVFDQRLTTQAELAELDARDITFIALRMRTKALVDAIDALPADAWTTAPRRPGGVRCARPRRAAVAPIRMSPDCLGTSNHCLDVVRRQRWTSRLPKICAFSSETGSGSASGAWSSRRW